MSWRLDRNLESSPDFRSAKTWNAIKSSLTFCRSSFPYLVLYLMIILIGCVVNQFVVPARCTFIFFLRKAFDFFLQILREQRTLQLWGLKREHGDVFLWLYKLLRDKLPSIQAGNRPHSYHYVKIESRTLILGKRLPPCDTPISVVFRSISGLFSKVSNFIPCRFKKVRAWLVHVLIIHFLIRKRVPLECVLSVYFFPVRKYRRRA